DYEDPRHHQQAECHGGGGEPHLRRPYPPPVDSRAHSCAYLLLSRRRTSSAKVLTTNVMTTSNRAERKSTRYKVPPTGASGISTATLAASARNPVKMPKSITGVFPVAMSTIMVSPTARPNPMMAAEKMAGPATGSTIRRIVSQWVAPRASEPDTKCRGTLLSDSSEMLKMMGMTAKPMAKATTSELRWSNRRPKVSKSHWRKSPAMSHCSSTGPRASPAHAARANTGTAASTTRLAGSRFRRAAGSRPHAMATASTATGASTAMANTPGKLRSSHGASHKDANMPKTTLGRPAMSSTMGFTTARQRGSMKWEV